MKLRQLLIIFGVYWVSTVAHSSVIKKKNANNVDDSESMINNGNCGGLRSSVKLIHVNNTVTNSNLYYCYGHLIHPRAVLIQAHCVDGLSIEQLYIQQSSANTIQQNRTIDSILIHPDYTSCNLENNVAMLILNDTFDDNNYDFACLPNVLIQRNFVISDMCEKSYDPDNISSIMSNVLYGTDGKSRCRNLMPMIWKDPKDTAPLCELKYHHNIDVIKYHGSECITCQLTLDDGHKYNYLVGLDTFAPFCTLDDKYPTGLTYIARILYRREAIYDHIRWIKYAMNAILYR